MVHDARAAAAAALPGQGASVLSSVPGSCLVLAASLGAHFSQWSFLRRVALKSNRRC